MSADALQSRTIKIETTNCTKRLFCVLWRQRCCHSLSTLPFDCLNFLSVGFVCVIPHIDESVDLIQTMAVRKSENVGLSDEEVCSSLVSSKIDFPRSLGFWRIRN
jgi:hypothetical protein